MFYTGTKPRRYWAHVGETCATIVSLLSRRTNCRHNVSSMDFLHQQNWNWTRWAASLYSVEKCYQTVVSLGMYTAKVPIYNTLKASKGTMFFLPYKTLETLDQAKHSALYPELHVILNGRPTKSKVVWRSLVDVNRLKATIRKLKGSNWLYQDVNNDSVDEAAKTGNRIINNAMSSIC